MQSFHALPAGTATFGRSELVHTERVLALGRAVLAAVSLVAVRLAADDPRRYPALVEQLLLVFALLAMLVVLLAWKSPPRLHAWALPLHVHDVLWAVVITTFTEGPASIFFAFFSYLLVSAAYRWGLTAAVASAVVANVLLVGQSWLLARGVIAGGTESAWTGLVVRGPVLLGLALFVGYLAEEQKRLQREAAVTSALIASARLESGLRNSLASAAATLLAAFRAERLWAVLTEATNANTVLCDAWRRDGRLELKVVPVSASEAAAWQFGPPRPCDAFLVRRRAPRTRRSLAWTMWPGESRGTGGAPAPILTDSSWEAAIGVTIGAGDWSARVVILDPARAERRIRRAAFLYRALRQAMPAFQALNLMQRLRTRVGAIERARVARELHDGVIQSLSGLDMQIEAARRQLTVAPEAVPGTLDRVQAVLREEVLNVRDLMHQLRQTSVDPRRVVEHMTETVERFRRDTGIAATFASDLSDPELPRDVAREFVRMLQELLVNIRKHSGARSVVVRFGVSGDAWCLMVDDDGTGFDFEGRYTLAELDGLRRGPVILKDRVRAVGGQLWLTSQPGRGTRIEIQVSQGRNGS